MKVELIDNNGKAVEGGLELNEKVWGLAYNEVLIAQALYVYNMNQRKATANAKARGDVSGGGKKPWRQKGTGRARAGSTRSPLWVIGGVTFVLITEIGEIY
jgi:large subunit ribosomal protein L4